MNFRMNLTDGTEVAIQCQVNGLEPLGINVSLSDTDEELDWDLLSDDDRELIDNTVHDKIFDRLEFA